MLVKLWFGELRVDLLSRPEITVDDLQRIFILQLSLCHFTNVLKLLTDIPQNLLVHINHTNNCLVIHHEFEILHLLIPRHRPPQLHLLRAITPIVKRSEPDAKRMTELLTLRLECVCRPTTLEVLEGVDLEIHGTWEVLLDLGESLRVVVVEFGCGDNVCRINGWRKGVERYEGLVLYGLQLKH